MSGYEGTYERESRTYFQNKQIDLVMESFVAGVSYERPLSPLEYFENCIRKIRSEKLLSKDQSGRLLQWDTFLPKIPIRVKVPEIESKVLKREIPPLFPYKRPVYMEVALPQKTYEILPSIGSSAAKSLNNIIFAVGGPGSGKEAQLEKIAKDQGYVIISIEKAIEREISAKSLLGLKLEQSQVTGIPSKNVLNIKKDLTLTVLVESIKRNADSKGIIIDGFPTTIEMALEFERILVKPKMVLFYEANDIIALNRVLQGNQTGKLEDQIPTDESDEEIFQNSKYIFKPKPLNHPNITFVLGGPGSGKGTQCERLAVEFNLTHISTGDILRAEVEKQSKLGQMAEELMKAGKMVPSQLLMEMLREKIIANFHSEGFLIDGFPRSMEQAYEFEETIGPCRQALHYKCSLSILEQRLLERGKSSGRADDNIDTIKKRFLTFQEQSMPAIEYFKYKGKCVEISSEKPIAEVYEESKKYFQQEAPVMHRNLIIVLGGPGSGKGTQCEKIKLRHRFGHISTGDLLRIEVKGKTDIGLKVEKIVASGRMVPTNIILALLKKEILKNISKEGILIDGFPRSVEQALEFERVICEPRAVLNFECPTYILKERILSRGQTSGRADDSDLKTIMTRFQVYHKESVPVKRYYEEKGLVTSVSTIPAPDQVFQTISASFDFSQPWLPLDRKKLVFVIGAPYSGKGTQSKFISDVLGYEIISIESLKAEEMLMATPLGKKLEYLKYCNLPIPPETVIDLLDAGIRRMSSIRILIDGFPNNLQEAIMFEKKLTSPFLVLNYTADEKVSASRSFQKDDSRPVAVQNAEVDARLLQYRQRPIVVEQFYEQAGKLKTIDANKTMENVYDETLKAFK